MAKKEKIKKVITELNAAAKLKPDNAEIHFELALNHEVSFVWAIVVLK